MWEKFTSLKEIERLVKEDTRQKQINSIMDMIAGAGLAIMVYVLMVFFMAI